MTESGKNSYDVLIWGLVLLQPSCVLMVADPLDDCEGELALVVVGAFCFILTAATIIGGIPW